MYMLYISEIIIILINICSLIKFFEHKFFHQFLLLRQMSLPLKKEKKLSLCKWFPMLTAADGDVYVYGKLETANLLGCFRRAFRTD